jgi:hypothetical protein
MKTLLAEREEKGYFTGPLDQYGARIGAMTGAIAPESAEWRRKVTSQLNRYIKEMTGAQLSAAEAKRLLKGMPNEGDQEEIFDEKMEGLIGEIEQRREQFLKTRRWVGKTTGPHEKVRFKVPGRGTASVSAAEADEFQRDWPDAERQSGG